MYKHGSARDRIVEETSVRFNSAFVTSCFAGIATGEPDGLRLWIMQDHSSFGKTAMVTAGGREEAAPKARLPKTLTAG